MADAQREPRRAADWLNEGLTALTRQDWTAARVAFETAHDLAPDSPDPCLNLGSLCQLQQDHEQAIHWYSLALQCDPGQVQARYCRSLSLAAHQRWAAAQADLDQVIAVRPDLPEPYLNRGYVARALGDLPHARADWTHFLALPDAADNLKAQVRIWLAEIDPQQQGGYSATERLQLARQAYQIGDGASALRHYDAVLTQEATHREARLARAHLYAVLDQPQAARRDLALLLEQYPEDGELWYHQAVLQRRWGDTQAAMQSLDQAAQLAPDLPEVFLEQGYLLRDTQPMDALSAFQAALQRNPDLQDARLARAKLYQQQGQDLLAVADYREMLARDSTLLAAYQGLEVILARFTQRITEAPEQTRPYIARANLYQQLGRLEESLHDWSEALRLEPDNALLIAGRAQVLAEQQQYPAAHAEYTRALELMPDQAGFYFSRAEILVALLRTQPALADLDRAIALAPEKGGYYLLRGMLLRQLEKPEAARQDLDQAIALAPELVDAWRERALLHLMAQQLPEALRDYQRAVALQPTAELHRDCAAVAEALDQAALALDHLNQALRLIPDQVDALLERAELLLAQGNWARALQDLDAVLDQEPTLVQPWVLRARGNFQLQRWEAAASDASRALVRDPFQLEAYYLRGISYFEMGTYGQAARDLRRYLQSQPETGNREQVLRLIRLADSHQRSRRKAWWRR